MDDLNKTLTFNLFARPSFIEGISRVFDFGATLQMYNYSKGEKKADSRALNSDWRMVGQDIESALEQYGQKK